ncbi:MAG: cupin domain-containing protein [Steroidobacter sp.]
MAETPLPPIRRIVTGNDERGRSCIVDDGAAPAMMTMAERPGYRNNNLWRTAGSPAQIAAPDTSVEHRGVLPPKGGTVLRVIDIPPEEKDPELRRRQTEAVFASMFADAKHDPAHTRHPGMHVTDTIDYAILLQGELVAIMDEGEIVMRAGDILIQRGTNHAWANRSNEIARIAFILIDARR